LDMFFLPCSFPFSFFSRKQNYVEYHIILF
jgi:hypothetical protein